LDEPRERGEGLDQGRGVRKSVAITAAATAAFFAAAAPSATAAATTTTSFTALSATTAAPSTATATPAAAAVATTTTTATSESATATAAAFTGRTLFTRARDVDRESPTAKVLAIEHFDGAFGLLGGAELDKRESA
jgi:hypothetical protein